MSYCKDYFNYERRQSQEVAIGKLRLGGKNAVRLQSMTNTSTLDTPSCVAQAKEIVQAGGELVRLTAQGVKEANNLADIRQDLRSQNIETPLVADIHFNPKAAEAAAHHVEKVRINPGNFADPMPSWVNSTEDEQAAIRERFVPFLNLCKTHQTAIRIGVNHGSLSARMMKRYGDTPQGMVASCMEYLRICLEEDFHNVVISIKASNTLIMVQTVRLLAQEMAQENMHFPLHLGVTEAGEGEDGRIKSAVGIGSLLADGIGDTIRVSLSEDPQVEIPVARLLRDHIVQRAGHAPIHGNTYTKFDPFHFQRRQSHSVLCIGQEQTPVVIANWQESDAATQASGDAASASGHAPQAEFYYTGKLLPQPQAGCRYICDSEVYQSQDQYHPLFCIDQLEALKTCRAELCFLQVQYQDIFAAGNSQENLHDKEELLTWLKSAKNVVLVIESHHQNPVGEMRAFFHALMLAQCTCPVVMKAHYQVESLEQLQLYAAADFGALLLDGFSDGLFLSASQHGERARKPDSLVSQHDCISTMLAILQAARWRISRTEYISCPGCGRTLFDLQSTIAHVKAGTAHLKGLKIAIMGCIVNGPGEMADADYGYVGAGRGKISLYKGQHCIAKNIPQDEALPRLLELIQQEKG